MTKNTFYRYSVNVYDDETALNEDRCGISMATSWFEAIEQLEGWFGKDNINKISIEWLSEEGTLLDMPENQTSKDFIENFVDALGMYDV